MSVAIFVKFSPSQQESLFNEVLIMFFIGFRIFSYSNRPYTTIIGYTKPYAKPIKFIIKLYANHNTLLFKHTTC